MTDLELAKELGRAYLCGRAYGLGLRFAGFAQDAAKWITVHPNGRGVNANGGDIKGVHALIDSESGKVLGGLGGKFTGKKISEVKGKYSGGDTAKQNERQAPAGYEDRKAQREKELQAKHDHITKQADKLMQRAQALREQAAAQSKQRFEQGNSGYKGAQSISQKRDTAQELEQQAQNLLYRASSVNFVRSDRTSASYSDRAYEQQVKKDRLAQLKKDIEGSIHSQADLDRFINEHRDDLAPALRYFDETKQGEIADRVKALKSAVSAGSSDIQKNIRELSKKAERAGAREQEQSKFADGISQAKINGKVAEVLNIPDASSWNSKIYTYKNGAKAVFVNNKKIELSDEQYKALKSLAG